MVMAVAILLTPDLIGTFVDPSSLQSTRQRQAVAAMVQAGPQVNAGAAAMMRRLKTTAATAAEAQQMVRHVLAMAPGSQDQQCLDESAGVLETVIARGLGGPPRTQEECLELLAKNRGDAADPVTKTCLSGVLVRQEERLVDDVEALRRALSTAEVDFVKWILLKRWAV